MPTSEGKLNVNDFAKIMEANSKADKALDRVEEALRLMQVNNKPTNGELALMIKNLTENVEKGFIGVHARQDTANHGIQKNRDRVSALENWRWYIIGGGSVFITALTLGIKFIN